MKSKTLFDKFICFKDFKSCGKMSSS